MSAVLTPEDLEGAEIINAKRDMDPTPKQVTFLRQSRLHRFMLYGGARGGAKSYLLRWGLLDLLLTWWKELGIKNIRVGLFCETYPELRDRQISKIKAEFPAKYGKLKATQDEGLGFYLHEHLGGGAILLRNLDDPSKYQSAEFAAVAVDELTKHLKAVFDILRGSLRWPGIDRPVFWGATNPGGPGHTFVKGLWIDRDFPPEMKALEHEFGFVQALPSDNPHLPQSYWDDLNTLPTQLRNAWVLGLWDAFVGQAFDEWRPGVHGAKLDQLPDTWRVAGGMDWGYDHPGWFGLAFLGFDGRIHWRWEYSFGRGTKNGPMTPFDVGFAIGTNLSRTFPRPPIIVIDSATQADNWQGQTVVSDFTEIQRGLNAAYANDPFKAPQLVPAVKGQGSRATRKTIMHGALKWLPGPNPLAPMQDIPSWGRPKMTVDLEACPELARTIPLLFVEEDHPEKIDKEGPDDPFDGATYLMSAMHPAFAEDEPVQTREGQHPGFTPEGKLRHKGETEAPVRPSRWQRLRDGEELDLDGSDLSSLESIT